MKDISFTWIHYNNVNKLNIKNIAKQLVFTILNLHIQIYRASQASISV